MQAREIANARHRGELKDAGSLTARSVPRCETIEEYLHDLPQKEEEDLKGVPFSVILADTEDQVRSMNLLEHFLQHAEHLSHQTLFQLQAHEQDRLVSVYYALDNVFARELLGRKLKSSLRKELDDIGEKTGVRISSCKRQFNNIRRVWKALDTPPNAAQQPQSSLSSSSSLLSILKQRYHLSDKLARKYLRVVFFAHHQFEATKKRLAYLTFEDFDAIAQILMQDWCTDATLSLDFRPRLTSDLAIIKSVFSNDKNLVNSYRELCTQRKRLFFDKFHAYFKALTSIGADLGSEKEVKDFFTDLQEKFVDPLAKLHISAKQVTDFLHSLSAQFDNLVHVREARADTIRQLSGASRDWKVYLSAMEKVLEIMFTAKYRHED